MSLAMDKAQRETFLAGVHVGVLAIPDPGRGPLNAPIWYGYEPGGDVWLITGADSRKGRLLRRDVRVSLVAQNEAPPYQYVSVEGPVVSLERACSRAAISASAAETPTSPRRRATTRRSRACSCASGPSVG